MNDVVSACNDPGLIPILVAIKKMLSLMQIIGPILALVMMAINLIMLVNNPENKKAIPKIRNSAIALVVLFMVPVIVNAFFGLLDNSTSISSCWNSAVTNNNGSGNHYIPPEQTTRPTAKVYVSPEEYRNKKSK